MGQTVASARQLGAHFVGPDALLGRPRRFVLLAPATDDERDRQRRSQHDDEDDQQRGHSVGGVGGETRKWSSRSCASLTGLGAPISRSRAAWLSGKAITSRRLA